jgi:autotransporter-associated beta strand protein
MQSFIHRWVAGFLMCVVVTVVASPPLAAVTTADYVVQVAAVPSESPVQIQLTWPSQSATGFTVQRRVRGVGLFTTLATPGGTATGYTDATAVVGTVYEYRVIKAGTTAATSDITAAIRAPLVDDHGTVVLVVDATMVASLADEIARLEDDLVGDGWKVIRHDVPRHHVDQAGWKAAVVAVRNLIIADRAADPAVNSVLLLGHVPVPYSGQIAPDGHTPDHYGAWPADAHYGDLDGTWTDTTVNTTAPNRTENDNIPGDGKFDQSNVPSTVELAVGRIDLARMGVFGLSEAALLRRHLDRHHAFRHKAVAPARRGLIDDNFGAFGGEAFAASGWGSYAALVGHANVSAQDYLTTLAGNDYLLAYGCGGGSLTSAGGVGTSTQYAATNAKAVHTLLFGSYFGDWDSQNNFLRAPLAADGWGLTCAWAGRPSWSLQSMAVGDPIGASLLAVQNTSSHWAARSVHVALMGDPTLRLHAAAPPGSATASVVGADVAVAWSASPDVGMGSGEGYHVYRGTSRLGPFTRLTPIPVTALAYTDVSAAAGACRYLVRAVALETSGTATYLNASQAVAADVLVGGATATLHLLAPNGGEVVTAGGTAVVRWDGIGGGQVVIEVSLDGGLTWISVGAAGLDDGAATITLPAVAAGDARVRVRPAAGGPGDVSDAGFVVRTAGTGIWDGGAGDLLWTSPANWTGDAVPAVGQSVQFNTPLASTTVTIDQAQDLGALRITTGGSATWNYTGSGTLALRGGLTTSGAASVNFTDAIGALGLTASADQVWDLGGGAVTLTNVALAGPGLVTKRGAASLVLTGGGSSWSGGLRLERGTVSARQPHALGSGQVAFGTDAGTGLTVELTYASTGDGGTVINPFLVDNGRNGSNSNLISLAGWGGTRTTTLSGTLASGANLDPSARFLVDADSNRTGEVSTLVFSGSHAAFDRAGVEMEVRTGTVVLANAAAVVGPDTGYIVGGDSTRRHAALLLGSAFTLDRPITVGAASAHADAPGAPVVGCRQASGTAVVAGAITLPASGAPALRLLAYNNPGGTLRITGTIDDAAGSAGVAIGGAVASEGTLLTTGSATPGTVVLAAPGGSTYHGGTTVLAPLEIGNLTGSATGPGPVVLSGALVGLRVATAGTGYTTAATVTIPVPGGPGTVAVGLVAAVSGGALQQMRLINPGSGYAAAPVVTVGTGTGGVVEALMSYGRLGGTGSVAGAVTVGANCRIAPGVGGVGTLATGAMTFGAGSTYAVDLSGAACDRVVVNGNLDLGAAETLAVSGVPTGGTTYVIATWTGSRTGSFDSVTGLPGGWSVYADDAGKRLVIAQAAPAGGVAPEVAVSRDGLPVADGGTDVVGGLQPGVAVIRSWSIANVGTGVLTLGVPMISGMSNCTAMATALPGTSVPAGGATTLGVQVTPAAAGAWSFALSVPCDDADENPCDWTVSGSAVGQPELQVLRGTRPIPSAGSDIGNGGAAGSALVLGYTIANTGTAALNVTLPLTISGLSNCLAAVQTSPAAVIGSGSSSPCSLAVTPAAAGAWSFTVSFSCDDADENPTTWTIAGAASGIPEIDLARGGPIANGATDVVGSMVLGASQVLTYAVSNLGTSGLAVGGPVLLSATSNCTALVTAVPASLLAAGGSGALSVTVTPTAVGAWSFQVSAANGDADEGLYQWTASGTAVPPGPEIGISRGAAIADGGTDGVAGSAAGAPSILTWTIANAGGAALMVAGPGAITGSNCSVNLVQAPASPLAAGSATTLVMEVTPTAPGAWSFPLSLVNDDADENPYDWTVSGTAILLAPEIDVSRAGIAVTDGGTDAVASSVQGNASVLTWTIANAGNATLNLGDPGVIVGSNCTVVVDSAPSATVAALGSTSLVVRVTPTAPGGWSFPLSLATNDADESPADWTVTGSTAPEAAVSRSGMTIADGGTDAVAGMVQAVPTTVTWSIANLGSAVLTAGGPGAVVGSNCTVVVNSAPMSPVAVGGSSTLVLLVTPTAAGAWSFPLALATDDADENPYDWTVSGTAAPTPVPEIGVRRLVDLASGSTDTAGPNRPGVALPLTWSVLNTGSATLTLTPPGAFPGGNCTVAVVTGPSASVPPGTSTDLAVLVTPDALGPWSFTVTVVNDDADENPFSWTVSGVATAPEVEVSRAGSALANGATDRIEGVTAGQSLTLSYVLDNLGSGELTLGGPAGISGSNCAITVISGPATSVAAGDSTTLVATVVPLAAGEWSFTLTLTSNDGDENPCLWQVAGSAVAVASAVAVPPLEPLPPLPGRSAGPIGAGSVGNGCGLGGLGLVLSAAAWLAGGRRRRR